MNEKYDIDLGWPKVFKMIIGKTKLISGKGSKQPYQVFTDGKNSCFLVRDITTVAQSNNLVI